MHEFLPHEDAAICQDLSKKLGVSAEKISKRVSELHEFNPMFGHRGRRRGASRIPISEMQARAVFEAAADAKERHQGVAFPLEIMIPLVGFPANCSCSLRSFTGSRGGSGEGKRRPNSIISWAR